MWLGSPADFWPVAYSAMLSTSIGSILLIIDTSIVISSRGIATDFHVDGFESFSTAFGTILFAFGGASAFPNFQVDMKQKNKFPLAVGFGFFGKNYGYSVAPLNIACLTCNRTAYALFANLWFGLRSVWLQRTKRHNRQSSFGWNHYSSSTVLSCALLHRGAHRDQPNFAGLGRNSSHT